MKPIKILLLSVSVLAIALFVQTATADPHGAGTAELQLVEATVSQRQHAMQTKLITAEQLVGMYLAPVDAYEDAGPAVNAFLYVNPNAEAEARALDAQRH